jgi:ryanodine receptor 2
MILQNYLSFTFYSLFCKLANLLRSRLAAFGADVRITVRCLQVLVKGIDAK